MKTKIVVLMVSLFSMQIIAQIFLQNLLHGKSSHSGS